MISRFNGKCVHCGKPTKAGVDHYDVEKRESFHEACRNQTGLFEANEAEMLAEKLGFSKSGEISN